MDMEQLQNNLEEALEQIDILTEERDNLKERYEDAKYYNGKMKENIDHLKSKKESTNKIKDSDEVSRLMKENEILKHELKINEMNLSSKKDDRKIDSELKKENEDLRYNLTKVTCELESTRLEYVELQKNNTIVKGELTENKKQLQKL